MKTPREILLQRHRSMEPQLGRIRREVISAETKERKRGSETDEGDSSSVWLLTLWQQLILPSRRIWAGLATLWIGILALNFCYDPGASLAASAQASKPASELRAELRARRALQAELLGSYLETAPASIPIAPRSDWMRDADRILKEAAARSAIQLV